MNSNKKAFKSGIWYTASNFLLRSIGFITTPIFTRLLTKAEFGEFNNYTSWLSIITVFVTLNLESTLVSAKYDFNEKFDEYILSVLCLSSFSCCMWCIIINCFKGFFVPFFGMKQIYVNAMLVYLLFLPAITLFQTRERYYFEYKNTVLISLILAIGTSIISVALVVLLDDKLSGRILGTIILTVLLGAICYGFFIKKGRRIKLSYWKYALPIALPYIPHLLSMNILNSTDRVMINRFCGSDVTALYSLAYNCGAIVSLLLTSMNSAFVPWLGEKIAENKIIEIRNYSKVYMKAFLFLAVGIMLISPEVLLILGGRSYMESIYVMAPVSMGCVCQFLYTLFVNVEQLKKKTLGMAAASMVAATINIVLNSIFIPWFGYLAAAYTTLIGYLCLLIIHMYLVYRLDYSQVYSYKYVAFIATIGVIAMIIITISYLEIGIRYLLIGVYCCALVFSISKYKKQLIGLFLRSKR